MYHKAHMNSTIHFRNLFVFSKDALAEKDQVIKKMSILTQQNQLLQQSVDDLQKDKAEMNAEKSKVGNIHNQ